MPEISVKSLRELEAIVDAGIATWSLLIEVISVFAASLCITQVLRRFLARRGLLDIPNARSSHSKPVPRGGGLSIALTFLPVLLVLWLRGVLSNDITAAIVGGGVLIAGVGLADDLWSLPVWVRALTHLAAASWAISRLGHLGPLLPGSFIGIWGWAEQLVAVIGLVWMINLYNFMDGIDALGGLEAVTAGSLGSSNFRPSQLCLLEANRIFLPSGVNVGAKLAHPKFVICFAFFPSAVRHKQFHLHRRCQVFAQQVVITLLGLRRRRMIRAPHQLLAIAGKYSARRRTHRSW